LPEVASSIELKVAAAGIVALVSVPIKVPFTYIFTSFTLYATAILLLSVTSKEKELI
jgi:hypothetical protein